MDDFVRYEVLPASERSDLVHRTLRAWAVTEFKWGLSDCGLAVADYVRAATGRDPGAAMRGQYDSAGQCRLFVMRRFGGYEAMATYGFETLAGLERTGTPRRGDVGLIAQDGQPHFALCIGRCKWAVRRVVGVAIGEAVTVLGAWRVEV